MKTTVKETKKFVLIPNKFDYEWKSCNDPIQVQFYSYSTIEKFYSFDSYEDAKDYYVKHPEKFDSSGVLVHEVKHLEIVKQS